MESQLEKLDLATKIGENIKAVRKVKGYNQSQLARAYGMDRQHMEKIENAKVSANVYTIYVISEALKVDLSELVTV
jgi:transcriptional regulator with XRE-family HTH domain